MTGTMAYAVAAPGEPTAAGELAPLGGTRWALWRDAALRGAGFPAERFLTLCDNELAAAADLSDDGDLAGLERYAEVFAAAEQRLSTQIRAAAVETRFREAVTWQNPALVGLCLDKAAAGEPRNVRGRNHELTIATYLQRYCLKNDTVGFFGPVGWARVDDSDSGLTAAPGPAPLARRTTYFESWAIDAVADTIAAMPRVRPYLRPCVVPSAVVTGWVVRLPFRRPEKLSAAEVDVLRHCDGTHTLGEIAGNPPDPDTMAALLRLRDRGVVSIGLTGPLATWPERELAQRLDAIPDAGVRAAATAPLTDLVAARAEVAAAGGDPERLLRASTALAGRFEAITGMASVRLSGATYAGRTLVYEDTVRGADVRLGARLTDALAGPLGLALDSALWLANAVADRCRQRAALLLDRELRRTGNRAMPLLQLLTSLMPEMGRIAAPDTAFETVDEVVEEFQERWSRVLGLPEDGSGPRHHRVSAGSIAAAVGREFATGAPRWSSAGWYSPDLMVVADDDASMARGDVDFVLGELHCASNTLENQLFVSQHPDPSRLRAAAVASGRDRRVFVIPRKDSSMATSRMSRAHELMLPSYTYVCLGAESMVPPAGAAVVSMMDLVAAPDGDDGEVVVRHRTTGERFDLLEVVGEPLSAMVADAFRPLRGAAHRPRVGIDRLVIGRESWTFAAADVAWAFVKDESRRYAGARRWRAERGLPERGFYRVPVERKPMAVDFRSLPMVNLLAKSVRRTAEQPGTTFTLTEMLPDIEALWLADSAGARYTAELRFVAVHRSR